MEYFDGVRVLWDGINLKLPTGQSLVIPRQDRLTFPFTLSIDGMLWCAKREPTLAMGSVDLTIGHKGLATRRVTKTCAELWRRRFESLS